MWTRNGRWILPEMPDFHVAFRNLLHAVNLRHGTDGFTSPPKEGVLRIFSPWKIRRLRPGLHPRTWVPKASTLPLDHQNRYWGPYNTVYVNIFAVLAISWKVFTNLMYQSEGARSVWWDLRFSHRCIWKSMSFAVLRLDHCYRRFEELLRRHLLSRTV